MWMFYLFKLKKLTINLYHSKGLNLVDEIHTILTENQFRYCFKNLSDLRVYPFPYLWITATLPPTLEISLKSIFEIPKAKVIRNIMPRGNLKFQVVNVDDRDLFKEFSKFLSTILVSDPTSKILVITRSIKECQELHKSFQFS